MTYHWPRTASRREPRRTRSSGSRSSGSRSISTLSNRNLASILVVATLGAALPWLAAAPGQGQDSGPSTHDEASQNKTDRAAELVREADTLYARRADSAQGDQPDPRFIEQAIALYEQALQIESHNLEASWKLLRAIYFQGDLVNDERDRKRRIFDRGRQVSDGAMAELKRRLGIGREFRDLSAEDRASLLRPAPEAAPLLFWGIVSWGLWGEEFGKLAAARQGVAGRIRRDAETLRALDPSYEQAGAHRILGRLHHEAPRVPFVTGWVRRETALSELERAVELGPADPLNRFYLAEALLDVDKTRRNEARQLLRALARLQPRPDYLVEDLRTQRMAEERLTEEFATP